MKQLSMRMNSRVLVFLYRLAGIAAGLWALNDLARRHHLFGL
jgi:hypothetical protein